MTTKNNFPFFIPSKGRYEYMVTSKYLTEMDIHHHIIVEPQEVEAYRAAVKTMNLNATILELDMTYKSKYELCDNLGLTKSTGSGPARNFAWDTAIKMGSDRHWTMDDNIMGFCRLNNSVRINVKTKAFFEVMEDFVLRYTNVAMAGPHYSMYGFSKKISTKNPFTLNSRIYSCNLIKNDVPFRWRGRYNEDTILSIDMLKAGWCTVLFNAMLQKKMGTQTLKGGNTTELYTNFDGSLKKEGEKYAKEGTFLKSKMLVDVHPDVAEMKIRYDRWHHYVNYKVFTNKLIRRKDIEIPKDINNYGMVLKSKG